MNHQYSKVGESNERSLLELEEDNPGFSNTDSYVVPDEAPPVERSISGGQKKGPEVIKPVLPTPSTGSHMFSISLYRRLFDVDTDEFVAKIKAAMNPLNKDVPLGHSEDGVEELYGFFWITATLIFLMFVSLTGSNLLSQWLYPKKHKDKFEYNIDLLISSTSLFYGYTLLVPLVLWLSTSYFYKFTEKLSLTRIISIYGYTNVLWAPITLLNFVIVVLIDNNHKLVINLIEWLMVIISGFFTGLSNISKINPLIQRNALILHANDEAAAKKLTWTILLVLVASHAIFTILIKATYMGLYV